MNPLLILIITSLRDYCIENHWDLLMVKCLALLGASKWYNLIVNGMALDLEMNMKSQKGST